MSTALSRARVPAGTTVYLVCFYFPSLWLLVLETETLRIYASNNYICIQTYIRNCTLYIKTHP